MLITIAITAVILIAALLGYAATRPDTFRVQRSKSIHAQPEEIFALINDFHRWSSWSPYEKLTPPCNELSAERKTGRGPCMSGRVRVKSARDAWRLRIRRHVRRLLSNWTS
jgi:hypothetical protein